MATATTNGKATGQRVGRVVQVIGSTFDAEFEEGHLPEIYHALKIDTDYKGVKLRLTGEVQREGVTLHLELSGKRAIAFCRFQGIPFERSYTHFEDKPTFEQVDELASRYLAAYIAGKIDRVQVAYMKFVNAARQIPVVETLLPLDTTPAELGKPAAKKEERKPVEYEFYPSAGEILQEILPMSFKIRLFKCFLDAGVSEQIARRVAMKAATENAGEIIKNLSREYNRARQAQITKEIAEVIGGVEALK